MKNIKGLSTIVTTLILVLLVLVAVGILWNPVKNLLTENTKAFENVDCLTVDLEVRAEQTNPNDDDYTLTITRKDSGDGVVYVKMIAENATASSTVYEAGESWGFAERYQVDMTTTTIVNATTINVIPYFLSESSGQEIVCGEKPVSVILA